MSQIPTLQPPGSILAFMPVFHVPINSQLIKSGPATNILKRTEPHTAKILWRQIKNLFPQLICIYTTYILELVCMA